MSPSRLGRRSWLLLALLFGIGLLNYLDRQTLWNPQGNPGAELVFTDTHYSWLVTAFVAPYIVFYVVSGRLVDRFGTRLSLECIRRFWSLANILSGCAQNFAQLAASRALLGGRAGSVPCYSARDDDVVPKGTSGIRVEPPQSLHHGGSHPRTPARRGARERLELAPRFVVRASPASPSLRRGGFLIADRRSFPANMNPPPRRRPCVRFWRTGGSGFSSRRARSPIRCGIFISFGCPDT